LLSFDFRLFISSLLFNISPPDAAACCYYNFHAIVIAIARIFSLRPLLMPVLIAIADYRLDIIDEVTLYCFLLPVARRHRARRDVTEGCIR